MIVHESTPSYSPSPLRHRAAAANKITRGRKKRKNYPFPFTLLPGLCRMKERKIKTGSDRRNAEKRKKKKR